MILFLIDGQPTLNPLLLLMTHLSQRSTLRLSHHITTVCPRRTGSSIRRRGGAIIHSLPFKKTSGPDMLLINI